MFAVYSLQEVLGNNEQLRDTLQDSSTGTITFDLLICMNLGFFLGLCLCLYGFNNS